MSISDNLRKLSESYRASLGASARPFANELAEILLWAQGDARLATLEVRDLPCHVLQASVAGQPATVFIECTRSEPNIARDSALLAYHMSIEWGILIDQTTTSVFNSHWLKNHDWFRLPPMAIHDLDKSSRILEALTPSGIIEGEIDKIASSQFGSPDEELLPVDDELVDRLDWWRSEALRYSTTSAGIDEKIQTLFAQLFVLRAVEDRRLAPRLAKLSAILKVDGTADLEKLQLLFRRAKSKIQSDLFDIPVPLEIPDFIHGGIIKDLYVPRNIPIPEARYNFSWVNADVLGRAYEKYLSTVLIPSRALDRQMQLFDRPVREVERISRRKAAGVYYTPSFIVRYLTERCADQYFEQETSSDAISPRPPHVADMACGSGSFLTAAFDAILDRLKGLNAEKDWVRELIDNKCIVGVDIDKRAVTLARLSLWLRITEEPRPLPLPSLESIIVCGDSLSESTWATLPLTYDIILGNPPFVAIGNVPRRSELAERFASARGRFDYSSLFIELAVAKLGPDGVLGLVVPNRMFRNRDASSVREVLINSTELLTLVDFGSTEVFAGISAYVGLLVAKKRGTAAPRDSLRSINVLALPPRLAGAFLYDAGRETVDRRTRFFSAFNARQPHGSSSWLMQPNRARSARIRLEDRSTPLSEVAQVFQGITTGANDIFIVSLEGGGIGPICQVRNGLGDVFAFDRALLRPASFGAEIQKFDIVTPTRFIIYPYRSGRVISEEELRSEFIATYQYFDYYKYILEMRSGILDSKKNWYELYRERDESWLSAPKLLSRDLATEPSFALEDVGGTFIVKGTAVVPEDSSLLEVLLGYLNSKLSAWYLSQVSSLFKAGFQKFEPQHLDRLPVPDVLRDDTALRSRLSSLVREIVLSKMRGEIALFRELEDTLNREILAAAGVGMEEIE